MARRLLTVILIASLVIMFTGEGTRIQVAPRPIVAVSVTLWGRILSPPGWGFSSSTVRQPGPEIDVNPGNSVTLSLFSGDAVAHAFCVDYEAVPDFICQTPGEPLSPNFSSSTTPTSYSFTARTTPGNYTYFCNIHGEGMSGKFVILTPPITTGSVAGDPARPN